MYVQTSKKSVQKPPARSVLNIEEFKGVDLYNSPSNVDDSRSPDAPNMVRDVPGKVRKRMGYEKIDQYPGRINGVYRLVLENETVTIVHAANKLYRNHEVIYEGVADIRGKAWQFDKRLYLLDGKRYLCYGEFAEDDEDETSDKVWKVRPVDEFAYVPTIIISRDPDGGGTTLDPINLLSSKWTESFYGKASVTKYQLTSGNLDSTPVTAQVLQKDGSWKDLKEGDGLTVNRVTGEVTFTTAPGASPITGSDNVKITASKARGKFEEETVYLTGVASQTEYTLNVTAIDSDPATAETLQSDGSWKKMEENNGFTLDRAAKKITFTTAPGVSPNASIPQNIRVNLKTLTEGYADRINKCSISTLYGVSGASDRLFVSGNPSYRNLDWYSQMNDPTFFGDLWYSTLGNETSGVMGYSVINGWLAAHKDEGEDGRNVILRNGTLVDNKATFPIVGALQGSGVLGKYSFGYLSSEPLFLTELGIYSITPADVTGERYSQSRSFYLNKALIEEPNQDEATAFTYKDLYLLAFPNGHAYVLDGLQKTYERYAPYSTYQYEGYYWENVPARIFWEQDTDLYFGTENGIVYRFYSDPEAQQSYNDDGEAIHAHWDLPDIDGKLFYKNKTFRHIAVRLASAVATGVKIWVQKKGIWSLLFDAGARARYFDFTYIDFGKFSFSSDTTPKTIGSKIKVKKVDKARYRLENNELNEPFGIYNVALEYNESGNYKGG